MPQHPEVEWLLDLLPPHRRGEVAAAIADAGITRLPPRTVGGAIHRGYLIDVDQRRIVVPDAFGPKRRARRMLDLAEALRAARGAEIRECLIAIDGRLAWDPPAWAWRCSRVLRDALAMAGMTAETMLEHVRWAPTNSNAMPIAIYANDPAIGRPKQIASLDVERPPTGDLLRATIDLGGGVIYREGGDKTFLKTRHEVLARGRSIPATLAIGLSGRPVSALVGHPLLDRAGYTIRKSWTGQRYTRAIIEVPECSLARLPSRFAAILPDHDRSDLAASPWR
ncbi:hypothetical protein [Sphingomonas corticis]|uniref:Uncharacterized protein n=1 Tax=Sphingomonas corticis TaxID=2722791 RepID=A0ABX1CMK2_9SPHN|nr:hypothetical protein [Sphingomonas corticis]NJR79168.1 hypothetical protein [Sphingomonas corticis]